MASRIIPLGDRVLLRELSVKDSERTTDSGIILPQTVKGEDQGKQGEVIACGPGRFDEDGEKRIPMDLKKGQKVLFTWGEKLTVDGETHYIVSEQNILGIIEE